ncbi:hypothetical protein JOF56_009488 [Kibdelosporangium banguiense]|uniref:Uncharacterized protein n=1 Tax=Kibdelosporangium banguiense TaxID=1365924 RepID=A0ABS4TXH6_9PSEU|nr:hypothetical protein [Kibdelosporangium banguiense]
MEPRRRDELAGERDISNPDWPTGRPPHRCQLNEPGHLALRRDRATDTTFTDHPDSLDSACPNAATIRPSTGQICQSAPQARTGCSATPQATTAPAQHARRYRLHLPRRLPLHGWLAAYNTIPTTISRREAIETCEAPDMRYHAVWFVTLPVQPAIPAVSPRMAGHDQHPPTVRLRRLLGVRPYGRPSRRWSSPQPASTLTLLSRRRSCGRESVQWYPHWLERDASPSRPANVGGQPARSGDSMNDHANIRAAETRRCAVTVMPTSCMRTDTSPRCREARTTDGKRELHGAESCCTAC